MNVYQVAYDLIDQCQLTAGDTKFIDMTSSQVLEQLNGRTCNQIRDYLQYLRNSGQSDIYSAMLRNPAQTGKSLPNVSNIAYALLDVDRGNLTSLQLIVSVKENTVYSGFGVDPGVPTDEYGQVVLTDNDLAIWRQALVPLTRWGDPTEWTDEFTPDPPANTWILAVYTGDDELYRWSCYEYPDGAQTYAPVGLNQVYEAFHALIQRH